MQRQINFAQAICEATKQCMLKDETVYLMGLGVSDPKGVFGTTLNLKENFKNRVFDIPVAENGMTGIAIGSSLMGMRPILTHQRLDFALMSVEQIINNAAKWHYMFGGKSNVPLTIRMIVGRGWGQGPQHSQNLHALFAHVPGLKVVMPFSPYDAKGLLIASVEDNNPVIFIENRWLHSIVGNVPENMYSLEIGKAKVLRNGDDISLISSSYMLLECIKAAEKISKIGIKVEVVDISTIKPLDKESIVKSVIKTGRALVVDSGYLTCGLAAELVTLIYENCYYNLKKPVMRITLPDCPEPTSRALVKYYYPNANDILKQVAMLMEIDLKEIEKHNLLEENITCDVPDSNFRGPF